MISIIKNSLKKNYPALFDDFKDFIKSWNKAKRKCNY